MKNRNDGFTLIEVLIALLIIAIALAASIRATNQSELDSIHVKNTMIAHWVALNIISELQTGLIPPSIANRAQKGKTNTMGQAWSWAFVENPSRRFAGATKITVSVFQRHHLLAAMVGYA